MNTEPANSLPIADEYSIPSLPELCAYRLGDTRYLSIRHVVSAIRANSSTLYLNNSSTLYLNTGWVAVLSPCRARDLTPLSEI